MRYRTFEKRNEDLAVRRGTGEDGTELVRTHETKLTGLPFLCISRVTTDAALKREGIMYTYI